MKKLLFWLCLAGIFFSCGCASNTIVMTPPVRKAVVPASNSTLYKLDQVKVSMIPYALPGDWGKSASSERLARLAEERYPALFKNSPEAVPVAVKIGIQQEIHDGVALVTFMGTLGILGGVLPSVPWTTEWKINVSVDDGRSVVRSAEAQAVHRGWWSLFSPCGLMTISGKSDVPAVSTVMTGGPGQVPPTLCNYVMERMVDVLAAELLNQNPAQWTEPSRTPVFMPLPGSTSGPLALPSETVAPF